MIGTLCASGFFDDKSLQVRTESGAKRLIREYVSRLKNLNDEEIQTFRDGTRADQIAILSLSACRTYALIGDFAIEVMNEACSFLPDGGSCDGF